MSGKKFRWGLSSPGAIGVEFTRSIRTSSSAEVVAVGSRDMGRARAFADSHGIALAFGSLQELASSPDVDGVYVSSPVHAHAAALETIAAAHKAILVEKPFAKSADEAAAMFATARKYNVFAMEAMWTRFLPAWQRIRALVDGGRIGEVHAAHASLGFPILGGTRDDFLLDPVNGGGALLEVGVYPAQFLLSYLGSPTNVEAAIVESPMGVDLSVAAAFTFGDRTASMQSSMTQWLPNSATISGSFGSIHVPPFFHGARRFEIRTLNGRTEDPYFTVEPVEVETALGPLAYQALHVADRVSAGEIESDVMSPKDTIATLRIVETVRDAARSRAASDS
jgi:predicted dehydrogenase